MKKEIHYKLIRTVSELLIITTLSTGISSFATAIKYPIEQIPFTEEDNVNNLIFNDELNAILNQDEISFSNPGIESIIGKELNGPITKEGLSSIASLEINSHLDNNDFSDLKYLPNLVTLDIYDNTINLEDLKYNQNIVVLTLTNCTISNTQYLPNSINSLYIDDSTITDQEVIIPYYTKNVYLKKTIANNLKLKNPSILESLFIASDVMLDLNNLKECINLKSLTIFLCSNVRNAHVLKGLTSLEKIVIDEYAAIWLDLETLQTLPLSDEDKLLIADLIYKLDSVANTLISDVNISEKEKINKIILYLLEKLDYDYEAVIESVVNDDKVSNYNFSPLTTSFEGNLGVCINYACMFQALCNRVGLDTCQLFNSNHTWNAIKIDSEYKGYDLTYLDIGPIVKVEDRDELCIIEDTTIEEMIQKGKENFLFYYEFDLDKVLDEDHVADYTPQEISSYILNIGYINENSLFKLIYKNEAKIYKLDIYVLCFLAFSIGTIILETIMYRKERKHTLIKGDITE